jgi:peptidylprolyl isomerase
LKKAERGDTVKIHYTGRFDDGTVFDSSRDREPLQFTTGRGRLIKGFENSVIGMSVGETKTVKIPPEEAYGARRDNLVIKRERSKFPPSMEPEVGLLLNVRHQDGSMLEVTVTEVTEDLVTLDGNHPLAGKNLTFEIELVDVS